MPSLESAGDKGYYTMLTKNNVKAVFLLVLMTVFSCEKGTPNEPATVDPASGGGDSGSGGGEYK